MGDPSCLQHAHRGRELGQELLNQLFQFDHRSQATVSVHTEQHACGQHGPHFSCGSIESKAEKGKEPNEDMVR